MALGFPGKTLKDENGIDRSILQIDKFGAPGTWFRLLRITAGEHKGEFIIASKGDDEEVLDIMDDEPKDHQYLVKAPLDYSFSQLWRLTADYGML